MEGYDHVIWSEDKVINLIQLVRDHPIIWDTDNEFYKHKIKRIQAFIEIATIINISRAEVERKWKVLQAQFRRECNKMRLKNQEMYCTPWFGYKHLQFLRDRIFRKDRISGENVEDGEEPPAVKEEIIPTSDEETWNEQCTALPLNQLPSQSSKRKRCKTGETQFDKLLNILHCQTEKRETRDSCTVFGEHIANKLRNYDLLTRANVEYKINCVLHEADLQVLQGKMNHLRNGL